MLFRSPDQGVRLVSYAMHWIKAEIHEYILRNWRMVKVATTKAQRKLFFNLRSMKSGLAPLTGAEVDRVARELAVRPEDVREMETRLSGRDLAFEAEADDEEAYAPAQYLADPQSVSEAWRSFFETDVLPQPSAAPAAVSAAPVAAPAAATVATAAVAPAATAAAAPVEGEVIRGAGAAIAANMTKSLEVPTATSFRNVPARLLEVNRQGINAYRSRAGLGKVSFTHIIAYAIVRAIADAVPNMNHGFAEGADGKPLNSMEVLKATFPAGTLTGAPKVHAMELIDQLEPTKRGLYGGACGYLSFAGDMDVAIAIRTGIVKNNTLYVQAAAGVVADSVPEMEWRETEHKARALLRAAELVEEGME